MLGKINPDNLLVEPEYNNVKVVFKSWKVLPMLCYITVNDVLRLYLRK